MGLHISFGRGSDELALVDRKEERPCEVCMAKEREEATPVHLIKVRAELVPVAAVCDIYWRCHLI